MSGLRLFNARVCQSAVAVVRSFKGVVRVFAQNSVFSQNINIRRKPLVHPRMLCFIVGQNMLKPSMSHFMRGSSKQSRVLFSASYKSRHRVFHTTITPLNNRILFPWILSNVFVKIFHKSHTVRLKFFPVF